MQITDHIHALKIPFQIPVGPGKTVTGLFVPALSSSLTARQKALIILSLLFMRYGSNP